MVVPLFRFYLGSMTVEPYADAMYGYCVQLQIVNSLNNVSTSAQLTPEAVAALIAALQPYV